MPEHGERIARLEEAVDHIKEHVDTRFKESDARTRWWILGSVVAANSVFAYAQPAAGAVLAGTVTVGVLVKLVILPWLR